MKFFLDSNVLVSGIVFPGAEEWLLRATFRGEHTFVISEDVKRETLQVMKEKFPGLRGEAEEALAVIRVEMVPAKVYANRLRSFPRLRDPTDAHILAAAVSSACDAVVTGDRDLLVLGVVEGVRIIRPSEARRLITRST